MKDLSCLDTIITDDLALHIDLSSLKSWNLNTGLTSVSITKWKEAVSDNIFLYDFGLTAFDNGRADKMYDTLTLTPNDNKVTLYPIGYNNATGGTFYTLSGITTSTGTSIGNYFKVNGGYLQGFFKLKGYNYALLPSRYGKGVTFETLIELTNSSFDDGYFLFVGARAEDKYVPQFSGETGFQLIDSQYIFTGVTTSNGDYLNNFIEHNQLKNAINGKEYYEKKWFENTDKGINENAIGFFISSDNKLGYSRINELGMVVSNTSESTLPTGWTMINIVFKPYEEILDKKILCCTESRLGDFTVYVNGRRFWKITNFTEYHFKPFLSEKEKQIGVPYNIGWGGATFGLKNSYHYDFKYRTVFDVNTSITGNTAYNTGFTFVDNPTFVGDCALISKASIYNVTPLSGDNTTFHYIDPCLTGTTAVTSVLKFGSTGITSTTSEYYLRYNNKLEILSNREYVFEFDVFDKNSFDLTGVGKIGLVFTGETNITVVEEIAYQYNAVTGASFPNTWTHVRYRIKTQNNTSLSSVSPFITILSDHSLNNGAVIYIKNFKWFGADGLSKDVRKNNELIESTFSKSFTGSIQKLRIYDKAFNAQEAYHNAKIEFQNLSYGVIINNGGRLIYV